MIIEIKKIGINGEGIGYDKKIPVFIEGALIGETVDVKIVNNNSGYKVAKINKVLKTSDMRIKPPCKNYNKCGGCSLMHTTYDNQIEIKKNLIKEAFLKYANLDIDVDVEGSDKQLGYRNCLKLPFIYHQGKLMLGVYENNSNYITPIDDCLIHTELLEVLKNKVLSILNKYNCSVYDNKTKRGLRYLVLREIGKRAHMCLITGEDEIDKRIIDDINQIKEIVSLYQCINTSKNSVDIFSNKMIHLSGGKHLAFKIDNYKFNLSIKSFFQLNTNQAKKLYRYVVDLIDDNQNIIVEAYSGIGAMSILTNRKAKQIVGVEYVKDAVVNANINANINKLDNVKFLCGDAAKVIQKEFNKQTIDTLIVNPPRSGLDDNMIDYLMHNRVNKIIYISCNPATLSKNMDILLEKYSVESIKAFDMFPNTAHVESVLKLIKK